MPTRDERLELIQALQEERGSKVISYLTTTRDGVDIAMAMDVIPLFYEHLKSLEFEGTERRLDVFIHSNGGDGTVPWRLISLLREYCDRLGVLVPHRAYSAATLLALGADEVIMHPMGTLGPTDPTVTTPFNPTHPLNPKQLVGVSVEDVAAYVALVKEDVGIQHEDELVQAFRTLAEQVTPLALGAVKRSTAQSRMLGEKLMYRRKDDELDSHEINEIITKLTSELYFHGHPINRVEARELGLTFVQDAEPGAEEAMWNLYSAYAEDMEIDVPFDALRLGYSLSNHHGQLPPQNQAFVELLTPPPMAAAFIESETAAHVFEMGFELTLIRQPDGVLSVNPWPATQGWRQPQ